MTERPHNQVGAARRGRRENPLQMKLDGEELKKVDQFKYLGSVIDRDDAIDRDVDLRAQDAWSSWKTLTGVLFNLKIALRLKTKVYETIIRPAVADGSECWPKKVNNKRKIATMEMMRLRGILGVSRQDQIRTEAIQHILQLVPIDQEMRRGVFIGFDMSKEEMRTTSPAE